MTISQELFELADAISETLKRAYDPALVVPLQTLEKVCDVAKRAWSGSNIGYHSTVYFEGITPKPAGVQFSPEWGLRDAWPTYQPDHGWEVMDHQDVIDQLLARAKITDISAIKRVMTELREGLSDQKEQAVSILNAAQSRQADTFLARQLEQIEKLKIAAPGTIAPTLVRSHQWSRDSEAITQGVAVAPHQELVAVYLSEMLTKKGLEALEKTVRLSATHMQRLAKINAKDKSMGNNIVIGHSHSVVWRDLKDFIKDRLHLPPDEFNRVSVAGMPNTIRLTQMLDAAAMAFIILTGEDEQIDGTTRARMNVIHEAGLFQGRLGFTKAIVVLEEGCDEFSNIEGLGQIRFPKGNIAAAFEEVRRVLEREGILSP